jgi:ribosomal protein L32
MKYPHSPGFQRNLWTVAHDDIVALARTIRLCPYNPVRCSWPSASRVFSQRSVMKRLELSHPVFTSSAAAHSARPSASLTGPMRHISRIGILRGEFSTEKKRREQRRLARQKQACPYNPCSASQPRNDRNRLRMPRCVVTERIHRIFHFLDADALNAMRERRRRRRSHWAANFRQLSAVPTAGCRVFGPWLIPGHNEACLSSGMGAPATKAVLPMVDERMFDLDRLDRSWTGSKSNRSTISRNGVNGLGGSWTGWTDYFQLSHMRARAQARAYGPSLENTGPTGPKALKSRLKPVHISAKCGDAPISTHDKSKA